MAHRPPSMHSSHLFPGKKHHSTARVSSPFLILFYLTFHKAKKKKKKASQSRQVPMKTFLALKRDSRANSQQPSTRKGELFSLSLSLFLSWKRGEAGGGQHRPGGQQCLDLWRYARLKRCSVRYNALIYIWRWTGHTYGLSPNGRFW